MVEIVKVLSFVVLGYILGSFPTGVIVGKKFKNIDIREHGSKNSGATNAYRVLGTKLGITVLLGDIFKGFLPLLVGYFFNLSENQLILVGVAAILGHTFSPFLNFKGGKGVATSLGVFLFLVPEVIITLIIIFIAVVYFSKYISLASIIVSVLFPILVFFYYTERKYTVFSVGIIIAAYIIYKHKSNIVRLKNGTENKFYGK